MSVAPTPCPWCSSRRGIVRVHGHGQCAACGANVEPCCSGDTPNDAATTAASNGHAVAPAPRLFPRLFAQLGGEHATVTDDALLFALSQHLDCDYDEARVVLEAAERVGIVDAPRPGLRRLHAPVSSARADRQC